MLLMAVLYQCVYTQTPTVMESYVIPLIYIERWSDVVRLCQVMLWEFLT